MYVTSKMLSVCLAASALLAGCAGEPSGKAMLIRHAKLTLIEAATIAEKTIPESRSIAAELKQNGNNVTYEIHVLRKVVIDAQDGRILTPDVPAPEMAPLQ
jgi:hypothetical protein